MMLIYLCVGDTTMVWERGPKKDQERACETKEDSNMFDGIV